MKKLNKKVCVSTGSRGDYDLLKPIIKKLYLSKKFKVNTVITGSHLMPNYNNISLFKKDKIFINKRIKIKYSDDSNSSILKYISEGIKKFDKLFTNENYNFLLVLGDRYEIYSAVISAYFNKIPIAHLSGGEVTEGAYDEAIRHSITKFSSFHFVANKLYKKRVEQLGENTKYIYNVGSTGVENLNNFSLMEKAKIEKKLNFSFKHKNYLITFHPVTFEKDYGIKDFKIILDYFSGKKNLGIIFTLPNTDTNNYKIISLIKKFVKKNKNSAYFKFLGREDYFSTIKYINAVIGNSSSGISEVPSLKKPTINIGLRQKGRIQSKSVISIEKLNRIKFNKAIKKVESKKFIKLIKKTKNPYYKKNTTKNIIKILEKLNFNDLYIKRFVDLKDRK